MSTDTDLATVKTPKDYAQALRDKIQLDLASLMPEDEWEALLRREITHFITPTSRHGVNNYHGDRSNFVERETCGLRDEVTLCLRKVVGEKVREALAKPEWEGTGYGTDQNLCVDEAVSEKVGEMVKEHGAEIFANLIGGAIQRAVDSMRIPQ